MSYIVKNCPARYRTCNDCSNNSGKRCQDVTDCVIKQVIEKCKIVYEAERNNRYKTNGYILANDILQLFDIEEINK